MRKITFFTATAFLVGLFAAALTFAAGPQQSNQMRTTQMQQDRQQQPGGTLSDRQEQTLERRQSQTLEQRQDPTPREQPGMAQERQQQGQQSGMAQERQQQQRQQAASGQNQQLRAEQLNSQQVRELQNSLQAQGVSPGPVDGIMGPQTQQAIRKFQQEEGLTAQGQIDQQTLEALDIEVQEFMGLAPEFEERGRQNQQQQQKSPEQQRQQQPMQQNQPQQSGQQQNRY